MHHQWLTGDLHSRTAVRLHALKYDAAPTHRVRPGDVFLGRGDLKKKRKEAELSVFVSVICPGYPQNATQANHHSQAPVAEWEKILNIHPLEKSPIGLYFNAVLGVKEEIASQVIDVESVGSIVARTLLPNKLQGLHLRHQRQK